jgi:predicted small secreted protein
VDGRSYHVRFDSFPEIVVKNRMPLLIVLGVILFLDGCNMWSGLGRDVQEVGRRMERQGERRG